MVNKQKGPPVKANEANCAGCLICEPRCSLRFEKEFNPSKAAIRIIRLVGGENEYAISFTEKCDHCGICVRHCPYGALSQEKKTEKVA